MLPTTIVSNRTRALAALKEAETYIQDVKTEIDGDALTLLERITGESRRIQQANAAFVLSYSADEYCPASMFKPWASVRRIQQWRDDPKVQLDVVIKNGRCAVRPSAFFAHWRTLSK